MRSVLIIYVSVLIVGIVNAIPQVKRQADKPVFQFTYGSGQNQQSFVYLDQDSSAAGNQKISQAVPPPPSPKQGRIAVAESQLRPVQVDTQLKTKIISESDFLTLYREAQKHDSTTIQHQRPTKPSVAQKTNGFYRKTADHPLAESSLETELQKLVNANINRYNSNAEQQRNRPYILEPQQYLEQREKLVTTTPKPEYHTPLVVKNGNDIVYIPYQQAQQPTYGKYDPARESAKAKIEYISPESYQSPSDAIEYGPKIHASFAPSRAQESFKDLYLQQQQQNQLKRTYEQEQQSVQNDILQGHVPPRSSIYVSKKTQNDVVYSRPRTTQPETIVPESHIEVSQIADRLFKTPLEQQKPLTQAEFKALVDAGYPVQAVPVPVILPPQHPPSSAQQYSAPQQQPQSYAPQQSVPESISYAPQQRQSYAPSQSSPAQKQPSKIESLDKYKATQKEQDEAEQLFDDDNSFIYTLLPGENEQIATEFLRQRVIQEAQSRSKNQQGPSKQPKQSYQHVQPEQNYQPYPQQSFQPQHQPQPHSLPPQPSAYYPQIQSQQHLLPQQQILPSPVGHLPIPHPHPQFAPPPVPQYYPQPILSQYQHPAQPQSSSNPSSASQYVPQAYQQRQQQSNSAPAQS